MSLPRRAAAAPLVRSLGPAALGSALVLLLAATAPAGPFIALGLVMIALALSSPWAGVLMAAAMPLALHFDFMDAYRVPLMGFYLYPPDVLLAAIAVSLLLAAAGGGGGFGRARVSRPILAFLIYAYLAGALALFRGLDRREVMAD